MSSPTEFGRRGLPARAPERVFGAAPAKPTPPPSPRDSGGSSAPSPFVTLLFSFEGRLRRRDYWLASIALTLLLIFLLVLEIAVMTAVRGNGPVMLMLALLSLGLAAGSIWSSLAIHVKRWHDRDKSGLWSLIAFIPVVGPIWMFVELGLLDGSPGDNQFGHSPKFGLGGVFD